MRSPLTADQQLERLSAEAATRKKRERRKANEVKQRTIQRMQLQMTAPLDIGLEFQDQSLGHGQEDILDLEASEKQLARKKSHVDLVSLIDDRVDFESDEGGEGEDAMEDDEIPNPEDEVGKRADDLEVELDGLYDAYQERMKERDAKYRVKEARRKDKLREEWHGIQKKDSDDEDDSDGSDGGYDVVQAAKARFGEDSDSDSASESENELDASASKKLKRTRGADAQVGGRQLKKAKTGQLETSRATSMWFDQDVFAGVDLTVGDDDDEGEGEDEDMHDVEDEKEGEEGAFQSEGSADSEDEFEVVPQEDQDEEMWDVNDEDQDEIKRSKIQSKVPETHSKRTTNLDKGCRIRSVNRRSCLYSPSTGKPGDHKNPPDQ